ncbi:cellulose binding domain-containing protein [Plantactinospora sp. KBS50]|uniref:cellulose binding domain-containing protein n=1 Tax=Plantactinospora sp. KBS50 TaxID=2024580 RepID=UPI000BAB0672|nr:cellulose binding domain-containing protein [Plantactinospora sp. KBS50]ASW54908.1 xyloglucanase [Plantactinospora sp. KBS50]
MRVGRLSRARTAGLVIVSLLVAALGTVVPMALSVPGAVAAASDPYNFANVKIGGGGFVPGIVFSPVQRNLIYARTDIGGMYRWNPSNSSWVPLLDWVGWDNWGYNGVVSIAPSAVNANKVWAAVGMYTNDWDPNNGAILRSSDQGNTWQTTVLPFKLGGNMPGRGMGERLAVDPNNDNVLYFAAPSGKGLWRSTDGGVTWGQVTSFPNPGNYVALPGDSYQGDNQGDVWVQFDKTTGTAGSTSKTIYVGVADKNHPVYRSTDGGATWAPLAGAPTGYLPHKGVLDTVNHYLYIATSDTGGPYDGAKGDVWRYNTTTGAWTQISPIPSSSDDDYFGYSGLTIDRQHPGTIMVATQISWWPDLIMWRSTDSGATWTRIWDWTSYPERSLRYKLDISAAPWLTMGEQPNPPVPSPKLGWMNESVEIDPFDSNHMLYGTGATIYGTNNLTAWDSGGTVTITPVVNGMEETAVLGLISPPSGPPLISALGDLGGFRHDRLDTVPSKMFTQPVFTSTRSIDYAENNPSVIVRAGDFTDADRPNDSHAAFSTDGGANWFQGNEPGGVNEGGTIAAAADGSRFVWAPGDAGQQVVYSVGFGNSWSQSSGVPANAIVASDRVNAMKFYAYSAGKFYVSTNGGASFTATAATGLPTSGNVHFKAVAGHEGDIWLAGGSTTGAYGLWHSTNSGASFTRISAVDEADNIGFGKAAPGQTYPALYAFAKVGGQRGVFRSDDGAASWVRINDDQHQYGNAADAITGDPRIYGRVYFGANGRGIIYGDRISTSTPSVSPTPSQTSASPTPSVSVSPTRSATPTPTPTPSASTPAPSTPPAGAGCTVAYRVTGSWQGGFQGDVTITNTGSSAINGWTLRWTFANGQVINQLWNGSVTQSGAAVTVTNASYNGALAAGGGTANFGFLASLSGSTNATPTSFTLNGAACTAS